MQTKEDILAVKMEFRQFYLAITNRCNLACIMCTTTRHNHQLEKELTLDEWVGVLENITRFKVEVVTLGAANRLSVKMNC
jgi:MoaA/NifB/PqqE/SkfB family radical SAM enzyme